MKKSRRSLWSDDDDGVHAAVAAHSSRRDIELSQSFLRVQNTNESALDNTRISAAECSAIEILRPEIFNPILLLPVLRS